MFISERLLRFARNDHMQYAHKMHSQCHCEGFFRSNLPTFIKGIGCGIAAPGLFPYTLLKYFFAPPLYNHFFHFFSVSFVSFVRTLYAAV